MPSAWTAVVGAAHRLQAGRTGRPRVACPRPPVLVVGAHPDDETLAAGGTIARLAAAGAVVTVVCATAGEASLAGGLRRGTTGQRRVDELRAACDLLGVDTVVCLGLPDGRLTGRAGQLSAAIEHWAVRTRAATILAPWADDGHADHRAVHRGAALVAGARRIALWGGEVWTPLPASHLVDIGGAPLERKRAALAAYATAGTVLQLEAILGLNRYRALAATPGCVAAEAYAVTAPG